MKDQGSSKKRNRFEEECYCGEYCICGIASDLYNEHAKEFYFISDEQILAKLEKKNTIDFDDFEDEDIDFEDEDIDFEDEDINFEDEDINFEDEDINFEDDDFEYDVQNEAAEIKPFKTPSEIEKRKSSLIGTKYFNNEFAIANCHLVVVEVIFKNTPKKDIPGYVAYATDKNFEILELKDDYVKFIAHYDPIYYDEDIIMNHVYKTMGYENFHSIVYFDFL